MTRERPIKFQWDGKAMVVAQGYLAQAEKRYTVGAFYALEQVDEARNMNAHNAYMAEVASAWENLSDAATKKLKSPTHLRKWALIETNWYDEQIIDCGTHELALRMATFAHDSDDYCEIRVRKNLLVIRRARSQKRSKMNNEDFKKSSKDVLDLLSDMIGVNRTVLERYARTTAQ